LKVEGSKKRWFYLLRKLFFLPQRPQRKKQHKGKYKVQS